MNKKKKHTRIPEAQDADASRDSLVGGGSNITLVVVVAAVDVVVCWRYKSVRK